MCNIVEGSPAPTIHWLKDGVTLNVHGTANRHKNDTLELHVPFFAYGGTKVGFEGNYTCHAFNIAGQSRMETHISLFGGALLEECNAFLAHGEERGVYSAVVAVCFDQLVQNLCM